jgi:hypothetical protein
LGHKESALSQLQLGVDNQGNNDNFQTFNIASGNYVTQMEINNNAVLHGGYNGTSMHNNNSIQVITVSSNCK